MTTGKFIEDLRPVNPADTTDLRELALSLPIVESRSDSAYEYMYSTSKAASGAKTWIMPADGAQYPAKIRRLTTAESGALRIQVEMGMWIETIEHRHIAKLERRKGGWIVLDGKLLRLKAMKHDEQAIRQWFDSWTKASKEGDLELARSLIADDAVFLMPGADRMDKDSFASAATASDPNTDYDLDCSIQEIRILDDHAWLWTKVSLTMTDKRSKSRSLMAGHSLSILKRQGDGWVVIRDSNTMVPVQQD